MSFDPIIALNHHVALLRLVEIAKEEVTKCSGINLLAAKYTGRVIVAELDRSRETLRANKMWVADQPTVEGIYRYSMRGQRGEHEISQDDLHLHMRAIMGDLERALKRSNPGD
ncbi:hypothetical protein [Cohnella cholangitidis]|uniref:Uncharacterized protein n=1 Tax=Cohnella cholangitidis TaxID=2598458 RepID=A0A7G5C5J7_9BACL|nr:hypothetical protein [Cohnella cholangitidis]QMV44481.1 hypothetical protein FPL14_27405 [Cohnella cholangitidis]